MKAPFTIKGELAHTGAYPIFTAADGEEVSYPRVVAILNSHASLTSRVAELEALAGTSESYRVATAQARIAELEGALRELADLAGRSGLPEGCLTMQSVERARSLLDGGGK